MSLLSFPFAAASGAPRLRVSREARTSGLAFAKIRDAEDPAGHRRADRARRYRRAREDKDRAN